MKSLICCCCMLLLSNIASAQIIKTFDCFKEYDADSFAIAYHVKVQFTGNTTDSSRIAMVRTELIKRYAISLENIVRIESWYGKRFRTFLYAIKVKNTGKYDGKNG